METCAGALWGGPGQSIVFLWSATPAPRQTTKYDRLAHGLSWFSRGLSYRSAVTGIVNATVFTTPLRWNWIHTR